MSVVKPSEPLKKLQIDLTPLIDVVFMLLVFFMLCTRFAADERNHQAELPLEYGIHEGLKPIPREQITVYCNWDPESRYNEYVVAIGARNRTLARGTRARLEDIVVFPSDSHESALAKRDLYHRVFDSLVTATESYLASAGAHIEKLEISFAVNPVQGAASGTAPWAFVSLAIDAAGRINANREGRGATPLGVTFKFADALGRFRPR